MRYADPALCPDCRSALPPAVTACPACRLLVRHALAVQLFGTLQTADALVARLRAVSATTSPAPVSAASAVGSVAATPAPRPFPVPTAPPVPAHPVRTGVRSSSVPKILLGLGALCLLVAAIVFLAVSWSALGVGGRTAVLAGFTVAAGTASLLLQRFGLRIAAESLSVVALGLLALDVIGAGAAGWFGDGPGGVVTLTAGLVLTVAGAGLGLVQIADEPRLLAPQVVSGIGLLVAYLAALDVTDHRIVAGHAFTAIGIAVVVLARSHGLPTLRWSHAAAAGVAWLATGQIALTEALHDPNLHELWIEGSGWSLLVTGAVLLAPGLLLRDRSVVVAGASGAATVLTLTATLPCIDAGTTTIGLVALGATAAWLLALALLPVALRAVARVPSVVGALVLSVLVLTTGGLALERWSMVSRTGFDHGIDVALHRPDPVTEPLLLVPSLLVLVALVALLAPARRRLAVRRWVEVAAVVAGLGTAATLASYDVALALPVGVVALVAIGAAALAFTCSGRAATASGTGAVGLAGAACALALPSSGLTLVVAALAFLTALALTAVAKDPATRITSGLAAAPYLALAVAAGTDVSSEGAVWLAVPVLLAAGVLALCLPRHEVELGAIAAALIVFPFSFDAASDQSTYTALWLTVAGCLVCATALLHDSRRPAAAPGAGLLLLATWVRLADLGVDEPEPYTLPLAVAVLGVGLWRMQRDPQIGTAQALLPGLGLALVPSLLWVLADPVSLRALLLGGGCLALTIAGAALRWSAPLLAGATVGAMVVVREIGAYPGEVPKWVWIGLAGMLLVVVGITWERRLLEVRKAVGYLGRLR